MGLTGEAAAPALASCRIATTQGNCMRTSKFYIYMRPIMKMPLPSPLTRKPELMA
jgi:hypothetical protein